MRGFYVVLVVSACGGGSTEMPDASQVSDGPPLQDVGPLADARDSAVEGGGTIYVKASNTGYMDSFGHSLAISADGNTVAVGATGEASAATGIGGNQADNAAPSSGAVYVFVRSNGVWSQQSYIKASNTASGDSFGWDVALSSDGNTLAVGAISEDSAATRIDGDQTDNTADSSGAVYVFVRTGTTWTQQAYVKASNTGATDTFGWGVALSASGDTLAIGAPGEASAAAGIDGDQLDNTAFGAGAVYVLVRSGTTWTQQSYVKASNPGSSDAFGRSVTLSGDGDTLVVGAQSEDSAATGIDGDQANNSAANSGAVYAFTRAGTAWTQQAYIKASNTGVFDGFGYEVTLSSDGNTLAVGAPFEQSAASGINANQLDNSALNAGAVYVFTRAAVWSQQVYIKPSNMGVEDRFGLSVALSSDGNTLLVGSIREDSAATGVNGNQTDETMMDSGAAYLLDRVSMTWTQRTYIKASDTGFRDLFGTQVCLSSDAATMAISAEDESSAATGIGAVGTDVNAFQSGAVYIMQ